MSTRIPVIFLAFANDKVDNLAYLRNLPKELDGIRKSLYKAQQAGLCEVVERASATIEHILDVFQDEYYKDRIAVFHYGGHANGYQLLLEAIDGNVSVAHSAGLVPFLARQQGLKLVFLNGCSSQQQALDLVQAGIPSVIGTSQAIDDHVATQLSIRFYSGLANGAPIEKAFAEAVDYVKIEKGTDNMRALYWKKKEEEEVVADRFPWDMFVREGAEIVKNWNLPETVNNPLFGLPPIPQTYPLPEEPFLFLKRYERIHAEVFFGRSYYIRDLYLKVTDPNVAPVILLYGQSGVGKSSLFDAGLNPRLEQSHKVVYVRRMQEVGLLGTLRHALHQDGKAQLKIEEAAQKRQQLLQQIQVQVKSLLSQSADFSESEIETLLQNIHEQGTNDEVRETQSELKVSASDGLLESWLLLEERLQKPLVIILDQAEEMFTRPNEKLPAELDDLLEALKSIFSNPLHRPKGKLILGYRKEYNAEIEERFKQWEVPRSKIFLEHLNRYDIVEVISGLSAQSHLKKRYNLVLEEGVAELIADDLLEDKDSPIAPVLQILLTKMWQLAEKDNNDIRYFSIKKYQHLKREGILMDDFFHQQMVKLREWNAEVVDSGLAIDVQMFHTTRLGTAGTRTAAELKAHYAHRMDTLPELISRLRESYLLTDGYGEGGGTALAHDTLAPLVRHVYSESDKAGQKACRILESKIMNYDDGEEEVFLDEADLEIVEKGVRGMRALFKEEIAIIELSRKKRNRKRLVRTVSKVSAVMALLMIGGALLWALAEQQKAVAEKHEADRQRHEANGQRNEANLQRKKVVSALDSIKKKDLLLDGAYKDVIMQRTAAERNARRSDSTAQIATALQKRAEGQSLKLLAQSKRVEAQADSLLEINIEADYQTTMAVNARQNAERLHLLSKAREIALKASLLESTKENSETMAFLALKAYLFNLYNDGSPYEADIYNALRQALKGYNKDSSGTVLTARSEVRALTYAGNRLIGCDAEGKIVAFQGTETQVLARTGKLLRSLVAIPGTNLIACSGDHQIYIYDLARPATPLHVLTGHTDRILSIAYSNEGQTIVSAGADRTLRITKPDNKTSPLVYTHKTRVHAVAAAGNKIAFGDENGHLFLWNPAEGDPVMVQQGESVVHSVSFSPDSRYLVAGFSNGTLKIFSGKKYEKLALSSRNHNAVVIRIVFNADGTRMATASYDGTVSVWDMNHIRQLPIIFQDHNGWVRSVVFAPDAKTVISAGVDKTVRSFTADPAVLARNLISKINPKLPPDLWELFIGKDTEYQAQITHLGNDPVHRPKIERSRRNKTSFTTSRD